MHHRVGLPLTIQNQQKTHAAAVKGLQKNEISVLAEVGVWPKVHEADRQTQDRLRLTVVDSAKSAVIQHVHLQTGVDKSRRLPVGGLKEVILAVREGGMVVPVGEERGIKLPALDIHEALLSRLPRSRILRIRNLRNQNLRIQDLRSKNLRSKNLRSGKVGFQ